MRVEQAQVCTCLLGRSHQPIVTRQRELPVEPFQAHPDLHLVAGFGALDCPALAQVSTFFFFFFAFGMI